MLAVTDHDMVVQFDFKSMGGAFNSRVVSMSSLTFQPLRDSQVCDETLGDEGDGMN